MKKTKSFIGLLAEIRQLWYVIQGKIIHLTYLDDLSKTTHFPFSKKMNSETLNLSFEYTSTDCIKTMSMYCILTSIHTASAVLSGPSGGQCLPMAHQL